MVWERQRWGMMIGAAGSRRRRPWVLCGLLILMLGAIWVMQGFELIDGAFFSNRLVSIMVGSTTILAGATLMLGVTLKGRSAHG